MVIVIPFLAGWRSQTVWVLSASKRTSFCFYHVTSVRVRSIRLAFVVDQMTVLLVVVSSVLGYPSLAVDVLQGRRSGRFLPEVGSGPRRGAECSGVVEFLL